ncbi:hypothetical protein [Devosia naphthalenivorans]|uniref:hypothetical protein n=1 Tax=Devosia naphthalenivorans TaxID=2082392 RepID=UPI000D346F9D|nr:hypothetical protein [Devosia naphthalenivorans]
MALKSNDANWFRPMWRRVSITVFLAIWLAWEALWNQDQFWAFLVGAALLYSLYNFFYAFPKEEPKNGEPTEPAPPPPGEDGPRP